MTAYSHVWVGVLEMKIVHAPPGSKRRQGLASHGEQGFPQVDCPV
ncbi:MAG TPA: hypothetical protein VII97_00605 [Anaerolineales bacterium]